MKKRALITVTSLMLSGVFAGQIFAADLLDVYRQALKSDPAFKAANEQWLAARENLPISRASLLPQLNAIAGLSRSHNNLGGVSNQDPAGGSSKFYDSNTNYSLNLTQSIFNFSNWAALWSAKASVKQSQAVFSSAAEDLMLRVANAYFAVLQAQDNLRFTIEHKKAVGELLRQQRQKFDVGLIPITDLNDSQASYDTTVAQEIADRTTLADAEEKLQEITGIKYEHSNLYILKQNLPLVKPVPQDMEQWVKTAERQNYSMLAARYGSVAARENIAQKQGGHLPQLDASGSFGYNYDNNGVGTGEYGKERNTTVGLQLKLPLFSGGGVSAQARQASYQYQQAVAQEEQTHRSVVSQTRQSYLGVVSGISKIKADRQEIKSKKSVLASTQNSYTVGLRTMVDVLNAQSDLYDSEKTYAIDQYNYILQTLTLKRQAGTLSANDLAKINLWLERSYLAASLAEKDYSAERVTYNHKNKTKTSPKQSEVPALYETRNSGETSTVSTQNDTSAQENNAISQALRIIAVTAPQVAQQLTVSEPATPDAVQPTSSAESTPPVATVTDTKPLVSPKQPVEQPVTGGQPTATAVDAKLVAPSTQSVGQPVTVDQPTQPATQPAPDTATAQPQGQVSQ